MPFLRQPLLACLILSCGTASSGAPVSQPGDTTGSQVTLQSMREPRAAHTATALLDGRVLIAGGLSSPALSSAGPSRVSGDFR